MAHHCVADCPVAVGMYSCSEDILLFTADTPLVHGAGPRVLPFAGDFFPSHQGRQHHLRTAVGGMVSVLRYTSGKLKHGT